MSSGKILSVTLASYFIFGYFNAKKDLKYQYQLAISRNASRMTGMLCNMPLPPYFRKYLYLGFGKMYSLNFDDIKIDDINKFKTFNQFFTREINLTKRPISDSRNIKTLCSPCDGRILSFGEVDSLNCTIDCIKGNNYRLDEFLFGYELVKEEADKDKRISMTERIVDSC